MRRFAVFTLAFATLLTSAQAVSLSKVIRACRADSGQYCKDAGYGDPMQACLLAHREKLTPECRAIVDRIAAGEKVTLL